MVASGSLVWCWRDGRWVPLRLSSIKLSGAVTKAHWDAVNEFLSLAASQRLFLQEGSLSLDKSHDFCSRPQLFLKYSQKKFFITESDVGKKGINNNNNSYDDFGDNGKKYDDNNNSSNESLKTCGELNSGLRRDQVSKFDVLSWLQNNRFNVVCDELERSSALLPFLKAKEQLSLQMIENQSFIFKNMLLVDRNTDKGENTFRTLTSSMNSKELIVRQHTSFVDFVAECLKEKKNNINKEGGYSEKSHSDLVDKQNIVVDLSKKNFLNYFQSLSQNTDNNSIEDDKETKVIWQNLVVGTKNNKNYNLDDAFVVGERSSEKEMTNVIFKNVEYQSDKLKNDDKDDSNDGLADFKVSPLQRHLRRPIKHKQPCRQPHKCEEKSLQRRYPLNRIHTHPPDNLINKSGFPDCVLDQLPRVNSLSQTRLEWHQLIQNDKEVSKEKPKVNSNKNSFTKVSISVLNLQRFSRLVRQKKNCDSNGLSDDKCKNKSRKVSEKLNVLKRSDSSSESNKNENFEGFRSLRNNKNRSNDAIDNYSNSIKDKLSMSAQMHKVLHKNKEKKEVDDVARYSEEPTPNSKIIKVKTIGERKNDRQDKYHIDEQQKDTDSFLTFSNWLQKRRSLPEKNCFPIEEQERYSDEPCQWQNIVLKQNVGVRSSEKKPKRYKEAWTRNIRKLSEGLRPIGLQE